MNNAVTSKEDILKTSRSHCRRSLIILMRMNREKMWNTC